jgi:hypothetical protein
MPISLITGGRSTRGIFAEGSSIMHASFDGLRPARRTTRPAPRFNGFEVLMFSLLGLALVDCGIVGFLVVRGVNW